MKEIILASASPRRRELLRQAGISFSVMVSDAEEKTTETEPEKVVEELAFLKARAVVDSIGNRAAVIGADTIVAVNGKILGKPENQEDAARLLGLLQGRTHQVYTGVAVLLKEAVGEVQHLFSEKTDVTMYPMTAAEIRSYIETGEPMDKAGAYGIQGRAAVYIKKIDGDYNNVVGLPIGRLYQEMKDYIL